MPCYALSKSGDIRHFDRNQDGSIRHLRTYNTGPLDVSGIVPVLLWPFSASLGQCSAVN